MAEFSAELGAIAGALAKAQASMGPVLKDKKAEIEKKAGGKYSYTYADLATAIDACRPALNANAIAITGGASAKDSGVEVWCMLLHESGQWIRDCLWMPVAGGNAQAVASAITYGRRYLLLAMVGLAPEDDDGQQADQNPPPRRAANKSAPATGSTTKLDKLRTAVDAKVDAWAERNKLSKAVAWEDACLMGGYPNPLGDGDGPWGCGFEPLGKINAALKRALAGPGNNVPGETEHDADAAKMWVMSTWSQLCAAGDFDRDSWREAWARWAGLTEWPERPTSADWLACQDGMQQELERAEGGA